MLAPSYYPREGPRIGLFLAAYFVAVKICLAFFFIATTTENIAVLIRPIAHAGTNFLVTRAGKRMHNRLPSGTHLRKLHAGIFLRIIFLIGARFIWVFFFFFFINTRPKSKSPRPTSGRVSPSYRSDPIPLGQGQACGSRTGKRKMGTSRFLRKRIHGWRHASKRPFSGPRGTKNHAGVPGMWATA